MSTSGSVHKLDSQLMKRVEQVVEGIGLKESGMATILAVADGIVSRFRDELGLFGGRLYRRIDDAYILEATFGEAKDVSPGLRIPASYAPIDALLDDRAIFMDRDDPRRDPELEATLGVEEFAAIWVRGWEFDYVLAFNVAPGQERTKILFSLGILRHNILFKLRQERMNSALREARRIQESILPRRMPCFGGLDIHGESIAMEIVGGDHFDFIPVTDKILGLAIADVSGHGLPAALQVRDIHVGLRMGLSRDFKISRTVERLNSIIHESTLTSRFVSMFYGELEQKGDFIYVNAGHPPPLHLKRDGSARPLREGGSVLGPIPDATYDRGFAKLKRGELVVFYTDGILEARRGGSDIAGSEYGTKRLLDTVRAHKDLAAREIVEAVFASVEEFRDGPAEDDQTVVVVRRPA
jgi:sigma-B regulation protein RsbU (phosphoserine phosphatase)